MPPLVTTSPRGTPVEQAGVLGQPGTTVLFGGEGVSDNPRSGYRFTAGLWLDKRQKIGVEGYFFGLSNATKTFSTTSDGDPILARPFFNVQTGQEDSLLVAFPGIVRGGANVTVSSTDLYSGGVDLRANVCCGCCYRLDLLGGYRCLHMREGVGILETEIAVGTASGFPPGSRIDLADNFGTRNQFNGGDLGFAAEVRHGCFYLDVLGRVALGATNQRVGINGFQSVNGGAPTPVGFLALPTNIGEFRRDEFAVVPQIDLTLGVQVVKNLRLSVGYTFLYWSAVARPGDQIDLGINPSQLPPGRLVGPARPAFTFRDTDFWAQGINFGAELRF